jgi:hypothetical protein
MFKAIGAIVTIFGIFLIIGNMTGFFPTFPFAGFIVTLIGGAIYRKGD